jgi:crotonobetainyl-CoA:carnitine CoA-transferase CaiB-like acyl-CoA transferase
MQHKPLTGIRILEFGGYISAPYATSILCALGAEVVKVEKPDGGDDFRRNANDKSLYFIQYNAGKKSLAVDLKHPDGVALVKKLIPHFDVIVENMRPGKLAALGLGPEDCRSLRADIVYTSLSGFGEGGPLAGRPAYDTIGQALGGAYTLLGDDGEPQLSGMIVADIVTALSTATGVLAALVGRLTTGSGQHVQTSIMEAMSALTADSLTQYFDNGHASPSRQSRHPQAQNFCLLTSSGEAIAVHLSSSQKFWRGLTAAMDRPELAEDPRFATYKARVANYFELVDVVDPLFRERPAQEWEQLLTGNDVPFAPVLTMEGVLQHPQTEWLDLVEPERNGVSLVRPPWRFDGERPDRNADAPRVGRDTCQVAGEVYTEDELAKLIDAGVLFQDS